MEQIQVEDGIACTLVHNELVKALCTSSPIKELEKIIARGEKVCSRFIEKYFTSTELLIEIIEVSQSKDFAVLTYLFTNDGKAVTSEGLKSATWYEFFKRKHCI